MPKDWNPSIPQGSPLTKTDRGFVARIAGRPRWICGKKTYEEALAIYHRKAVLLTSGRTPMPVAVTPTAQPTLHWLMAKWLIQKLNDANAGELTHRAYVTYRRSCRRIDRESPGQLVSEITPDCVV